MHQLIQKRPCKHYDLVSRFRNLGTNLKNIWLCGTNWCRRDEARQPLSRKVAIPSGRLSPYRMMVAARLVILILFIQYRVLHPVPDAVGLWLTSVICEIWLTLSWIIDQIPKWFPIDRETYLDRLSLRYIDLAHQNKRLTHLFKSLNKITHFWA